MNEIINVSNCAVNTRAIDIIAASSVLKIDSVAMAKDNVTRDTLKAFSPALEAFEIRSSSLFCFDKAKNAKKLKRP